MSIDISKTIEAKSDQLNADDLIGGPRTVIITGVKLQAGDQPVAINYDGDSGKPYLPCKSMRRLLVHAWGSDGRKYVGRTITLFRDPTVKWAGKEAAGIRISHLSDLPKDITVSLTASRSSRKPYTVKALKGTAKTKQAAPEAPVAPADLIEAGEEAAEGGVDVYRDWLASLSDDEKTSIKPHHSAWSKIAKSVIILEEEEDLPL